MNSSQRNFVTLSQARAVVRNALDLLPLQYSELNDDEFSVQPQDSHSFRLYVSPNAMGYFRSKHGFLHRRLGSSRHYVVCVRHHTTTEHIAALLRQYFENQKRGEESERIVAKALEQVKRQRADLVADGYKTGNRADMEESDFRVGIHGPKGKIFWIGLQVKSSVAARAETMQRWHREKTRGSSVDERLFDASQYMRRVVSVPRNGDETARVAVTAERIIQDLERVRRSFA